MASGSSFGRALRTWRGTRRLSQLELATAADVSQRHVSFLETGRSSPSREMVLRLADVLDVPLRSRNELLRAAGFAAVYPEHALDAPAMAELAGVIDALLAALEPYPAFVVDARGTMLRGNGAASRLTGMLPDPAAAAHASGGNVYRLLLHPDGLGPHLTNPAPVARSLLRRLDRELTHRPGDEALAALIGELAELVGLPPGERADPGPPSVDELLVPVRLRLGDHRLALVTTITTLGAPYDVTLDEVRIEALLPADRATDRLLRRLVEPGTPADGVRRAPTGRVGTVVDRLA